MGNTISSKLKSKYTITGVRENVRRRIIAAAQTMKNNNIDVITSFGWFLGGLSIMEMIQMNNEDYNLIREMKALVSFHGVFTDCYNGTTNTIARTKNDNSILNNNKNNQLHILICNGLNDPFVSLNDIEALEQLFKGNNKNNNNNWQILNFPNVKHGFTNPAQAFNNNPNFSYDDNSANISWHSSIALVKKVL